MLNEEDELFGFGNYDDDFLFTESKAEKVSRAVYEERTGKPYDREDDDRTKRMKAEYEEIGRDAYNSKYYGDPIPPPMPEDEEEPEAMDEEEPEPMDEGQSQVEPQEEMAIDIENLPPEEREAMAELEAAIPPGRDDLIDLVKYPQRQQELVDIHNASEAGKDFPIIATKYGYGLSTKVQLNEGDMIGVYGGVPVSEKVTDKLPMAYNKIIPGYEKGTSLVGDIQSTKVVNFPSYANDPGYSDALEPADRRKNMSNVKLQRYFDEESGKGMILMVARRDINPGSELLFNYGYPYWAGNMNYYPTAAEEAAARRQHEKDVREGIVD